MTLLRSSTKSGLALISVAALMVSVAACGAGAADSPAAPAASASGDATGAAAVYAQLNSMGEAARATAAEAAKKEGSLTFYTTISADALDKLVAEFTKKYGVKVNTYRSDSDTIISRIGQESAAHYADGADVVELNFPEIANISSQGLMGQYKGPSLAGLPDGYQYGDWNADRLVVMLPAWNTNLIKPGDEPESWEALADPRYKGQIQVEVSDFAWYENVSQYWLTHGKTQQQVDDLWAGIKANSTTASGHPAMVNLLGAGQAALDAMNVTYLVDRAARSGAPVSYRGPDGTSKTPAFGEPSGVAILADAPHPNAAWLFNDWLLDPSGGQEVLADLLLTPAATVPGFDGLKGVTVVPFDTETLSDPTKATQWQQQFDDFLRGVAAS